MSKRPHLTTAVLQVPLDLREVTSVLKDLSKGRHDAENAHRIWFTSDDGSDVHWPSPRLTYIRTSKASDGLGGELIIQATAEDVEWIAEAMKLITGMAEEQE